MSSRQLGSVITCVWGRGSHGVGRMVPRRFRRVPRGDLPRTPHGVLLRDFLSTGLEPEESRVEVLVYLVENHGMADAPSFRRGPIISGRTRLGLIRSLADEVLYISL